jgi:hypothetical protein
MDKLELTSRPERKPMGENYFGVGFGIATSSLFLAMALTASSRGTRVLDFFGLAMMVVFTLLLAPFFLEDWFYNRDYADRLQKHLQSSLSPRDYEKVRNIAKWHPEVQPWIADVMDANGRILYRDAERLQEQINEYLLTLPEQELKHLIHPAPKTT